MWSDAEREHEQREPLDDEQRAEDAPGLVRATISAQSGRARSAKRMHCTGACSRYQAIVCSSPSRSGVLASNPNSSFAREASRLRRGWPFGIEVSQRISPEKPVSSATSSAVSRIVVSTPVPRLTGSAPS